MQTSKKEVFTIFILLLVAGGVLIGGHLLTIGRDQPEQGTQPPLSTSPPPGEATTSPQGPQPIVTPLPAMAPYRGEPLEVMHTDGFENQVPEEVFKRSQKNLRELAQKIKETPQEADLWVQVGVIKKIYHDYGGARDAWEYATLINPSYAVSFANLANLYMLYLDNNRKAEENFIKAINNDPQEEFYLAFAELFRYHWPERRHETANVLEEGIHKLGPRVNFYLALGNYYEEVGNVAEAKKNYERALELEPSRTGLRKIIERLSRS